MYRGLDLGAGEASDAEVIAASVSGPERFAVIFERHFEAIHLYLARRLGVTLADDLAAQVFTIAFERRRHFDLTSTTARPWLASTPSATTGAAQSRLSTQTRLNVPPRASRNRPLRPEQREVLLLHCWADLSHAEIAAALELQKIRDEFRQNGQANRRLEPLDFPRPVDPTSIPNPAFVDSSRYVCMPVMGHLTGTRVEPPTRYDHLVE